MLWENRLTQKLIRLHTPEQKGIVEGITKTMPESLVPIIPTDYEQPRSEISRNKDKWSNDPKGFNAVISSYPSGRAGSPEEIAKAVSFLLSGDAAFISGANLVIDGGHLSQLPETTMLRVASRLK